MRRLERQTLALLGQQGLEGGERCSGGHRDHQLAGRVIDHAAQAAGVQQACGLEATVKVFATSAANLQRRLVRSGGTDLVNKGLDGGGQGQHGGNGKRPPCPAA